MENPIYDSRPQSLEELRQREFALDGFEECDEVRAAVEKDVRGYVRVESTACSSKGLQFVRCAVIDGVYYLLWRTPDDEFVTFELYDDSAVTSLDDSDGLTAEQFLVWNYLLSQWQIRLT